MPETTPIAARPPQRTAGQGHRQTKWPRPSSCRSQRRFPHPRYKKVVTAYAKFYAHDEKGEAKVGDLVLIQETRPLSKLKRWRLTEVVERSRGGAGGAAA